MKDKASIIAIYMDDLQYRFESSEEYVISTVFRTCAWALFPSSFYSINLLYVVIIYSIHVGVQSINRLSHPLRLFLHRNEDRADKVGIEESNETAL